MIRKAQSWKRRSDQATFEQSTRAEHARVRPQYYWASRMQEANLPLAFTLRLSPMLGCTKRALDIE